MPQQYPQQQPLESVETPQQLVARVVKGEALNQLQREALVAALKLRRLKSQKAVRVAMEVPRPTRATLNMSRLITDAMRPRLHKGD